MTTRFMAIALSTPLLFAAAMTVPHSRTMAQNAPSQNMQGQNTQGQATQGQNTPGQAQAPHLTVVTDETTAHVTVQDIDRAQRTATLQAEDGREFVVLVPAAVKNFDQMQKGDKITINYHAATAFYLRKQGEGTGEASGSSSPTAASPIAGGQNFAQFETVEVAPRGQKPAGTETRVDEITARVENVDYGKRKITLRGPQGNERTIDVGDTVKNLEQVKKGDDIVIRHTEAVAVAVTK